MLKTAEGLILTVTFLARAHFETIIWYCMLNTISTGESASFCQIFILILIHNFLRKNKYVHKYQKYQVLDKIQIHPYYQCCGSGSGSTCFWASRIRIHYSEVWIRIPILL